MKKVKVLNGCVGTVVGIMVALFFVGCSNDAFFGFDDDYQEVAPYNFQK